MFIPEPGQVVDNVDNFIQYKHLTNSQLIEYIKKEPVGGTTDQQRDVVRADGGKLKDFKLNMKVGDMQGMDEILAKFITLGSLSDVAFVMTEEFNTILNSCCSVFELQLFCDSNGSVQATVKKVILSVKYTDFTYVFSLTLVCKLPPHALYDHAIETRNGQPSFGSIYPLLAIELNVLKKYIEDILEKSFIVPSMSPVGASIFFTKKRNEDLQLCVNYQGLNALPCKNKYLLLLINEVLD